MSSLPRLQRALARQGITATYERGVYRLSNPFSSASVLLPAGLPLEEKAVHQLLAFAAVRSADGHQQVCKACATPDFHPGSIAPVGTIVATDADFVIPASIGTDINCGMRLLALGIGLPAFRQHEAAFGSRLTAALLGGRRKARSAA